MLVVVKTPHTEINMKGYIHPALLKTLDKLFGSNLIIKNEEESVELSDSIWFNNLELTTGDTIRSYRELMGWSQAKLGEEIGQKSRHYVSDLERNKRQVSKTVGKKMAQIFKIPLEVLIK